MLMVISNICREDGTGASCFNFSTARTNETIDGGVVGAYAATQLGSFAADMIFKVDFFNDSQSIWRQQKTNTLSKRGA